MKIKITDCILRLEYFSKGFKNKIIFVILINKYYLNSSQF